MADLSPRALKVLNSLVERYIEEGQPVASRALAGQRDLDVSSATVRNILADLEAQGYVASPHTSAGRVPTERGYRLFVDSMLHVQPLHAAAQCVLEAALKAQTSLPACLSQASSLLAQFSNQAGFVTLPSPKRAVLRHIEFLRLDDRRVLVILVCNEKDVQNRIIHLNRPYSVSDLEVAANFLNQTFRGFDLQSAREKLTQSLQEDKNHLSEQMQAAVDLAGSVLGPQQRLGSDYVVSGQRNLLETVQQDGIEQLRGLFEAFDRKCHILHLLDRCVGAQGLQIFIGQEAGLDELRPYSLVASPYEADGEVVGVLGVIGPTRMPYRHVMSVVDVTAKLLSSALKFDG